MTTPTNDDFDTFLAKAAEKESYRREGERYFSELDQKIQDMIDALGIDRLTDINPEAEQSIKETAIAELRDYLLSSSEKPEDISDEDFEEIVNVQSAHTVAFYAIKERSLLARIKISIGAYELSFLYDGEAFDPASHAEGKKQFLADLLIVEDYTVDDDWYKFTNTAIPGESIDVGLPENQKYLMVSMERLANKAEERNKNAVLLADVEELLVLDNPSEDVEENKYLTMRFTGELITIAVFEKRRYEREAQVVAASKKVGVSDDSIKSVLAYFETAFPLV